MSRRAELRIQREHQRGLGVVRPRPFQRTESGRLSNNSATNEEGGKKPQQSRSVTRRSVTNITRRGGLKESTEAYEEAVRKAGGDPEKVPADPDGDVLIREYRNLEDGTEFVHRQPMEDGSLAVEVQIFSLTRTGMPTSKKDGVIKIRFEQSAE